MVGAEAKTLTETPAYSVSRAMAKPKTQWPKSSAAMPFVAPAESR